MVTRAETSQRASADNARQLDIVLDATTANVPLGHHSQRGVFGQTQYGRETDGSEPRITGYTASNTVRVTLTDLKRVGEVIDAATAAGANQLQRVQFSLTKEDDVRARALREAAMNARAES